RVLACLRRRRGGGAGDRADVGVLPRVRGVSRARDHERPAGARTRRGLPRPDRDADVDTLVLGCTHYPLLSGVVQLAAGDHVTLVSSAEETAKDVLKVLTAQDMLRPHDPARQATREFLVTGDPDS